MLLECGALHFKNGKEGTEDSNQNYECLKRECEIGTESNRVAVGALKIEEKKMHWLQLAYCQPMKGKMAFPCDE